MQPETFYVSTDDGWKLAVHHFDAAGPSRRFPVLMVHGLGANRLHFDLDERHSMARAVWRRGFHVYVVELRGSGLSRAPGGRDRFLFQWGFGEHRHLDMPALLKAVLSHSGATVLHLVGHSMGGMLSYAAATEDGAPLQSITTLGTPLAKAMVRALGGRERRLLQFGTKLAPTTGQSRMPLRRLFSAVGPFIPLTARLKDGILLNPSNVEPAVSERMAREAIHDIPMQLLGEFTRAVTRGTQDGDGPYGYEALLDRVRLPVLSLSGCTDRVAPPAAVAEATAQLGSHDMRYREMGLRFGDRADYGHVDLLVGRRAPEEIYPQVVDFLEECDE